MTLPNFVSTERVVSWSSRQRAGWEIYTNMWATALSRRVVGHLLPRLLRNIPREVAEDLVAHTIVPSTSSLWKVLYHHDWHGEDEATAQTFPVLMLHGSADLTALLTEAQNLATGRATWEMHVRGGVDHHPWLRAPRDCLEHIERWLSNFREQAP